MTTRRMVLEVRAIEMATAYESRPLSCVGLHSVGVWVEGDVDEPT